MMLLFTVCTMANITLADIFSGIQFLTNATIVSGILSSSGITGLTSLLTTQLNTGVAGATSFAMASSAAIFAILVTVVALYAFDVMARSNSFATSRVSGETDEGKRAYRGFGRIILFWFETLANYCLCRKTIAHFHSGLGSISPTFYELLLRTQNPKAPKKLLNLTAFFSLLGSASVKAARRMFGKIDPC